MSLARGHWDRRWGVYKPLTEFDEKEMQQWLWERERTYHQRRGTWSKNKYKKRGKIRPEKKYRVHDNPMNRQALIAEYLWFVEKKLRVRVARINQGLPASPVRHPLVQNPHHQARYVCKMPDCHETAVVVIPDLNLCKGHIFVVHEALSNR